ncbi:MmyB family transcriptional regulator [Streptomyces tauricus]
MPKSRLALGLLDRPAGWLPSVPVIVADAGYGRSVFFRLALEDRSWSYVVAVDPRETVQPEAAEPYRMPYGGLGPPTRPCYREPARVAFRALWPGPGRWPATRYPDDREVATLVGDLLAGSAEFARRWAAYDVRPEPTLLKTVDHPLIGPITLNCTFLDIPDQDQQIVLFTVEPGSPAQESLRLLSVTGTQRMDVSG